MNLPRPECGAAHAISRRARAATAMIALLLASMATLAVSVPAARALETTFVPSGATWRYLDDGTDQGTTWSAPGFDDASWQPGPAELGYGDGDESTVVSFGPDGGAKYITTYFRHTFTVTDAATYVLMTVRLLRDDGAVVYLNGSEILRDNMPAGPITSTTLASSGVSGSGETTFVETAVDTSALVEGTNVLAVEIHQVGPTSSDISYDLSLVGSDTFDQVTRGPYLQMGTSDSVAVRWRTALPSDSRVRYGPSPGSLSEVTDDPALATDHEITLTGLTADTTYFYSVGTTAGPIVGGDAEHFFVTSPVPGTSKPTRIWVLGDSGTANGNAAAVRDAFEVFGGSPRPDLWLMLGDNAYSNGTDAQYQAAVFDMYGAQLRSSVLWPTLGNHDAASADSGTQTGPYYDIFTLPTLGEAGGEPSGTEAYYSFDHGNVHFICLDSHDSDRSPGSAMLTWLEDDLEAVTADWVIAFWHHPPYSKGSHDSDDEGRLIDMREYVLPVLEDYGVDLVLSGHSHSYERSLLIDGHYGHSSTLDGSMILDGGDGNIAGDGAYGKPTQGPAPHAGAVYAVAGSSGKVSSAPLDHPVMHVNLIELGSLVVDVDDDLLRAYFVDDTGLVRDDFAIDKGEATSACAPAPLGGCGQSARSTILLKDREPDSRDQLVWKWLKGAATTKAEFGDPLTADDYELCMYDANGLVSSSRVPAGGVCAKGKPCWKEQSKGYRYADKDRTPDGMDRLQLKEGVAGKAKVLVKGKGLRLDLPALATLAAPVTVQAINAASGRCWEAVYAPPFLRQDAEQFKAKTP